MSFEQTTFTRITFGRKTFGETVNKAFSFIILSDVLQKVAAPHYLKKSLL